MLRTVWDELEDLNRRIRGFPVWRAPAYLPAIEGALKRPFVPPTDAFTRQEDLVVRLELPGIDPEKDVKIVLEDGELSISGERTEEKEVKREHYFRKETRYGAFERRFPIPKGTDEKAVHAEYKNGVLEVVVKGAVTVMEAKKPGKAIPIQTAKAETRELAGKA